jgi:hypothetical protein
MRFLIGEKRKEDLRSSYRKRFQNDSREDLVLPYKRHKPASEEDMEKRMKNPNTICNILREMYHMTDDQEIRLKCRLAFSMGKAMCDKLTYYHEIYGEPVERA